MEKKYLMAVDLGTSFIKAGVYDVNGNCCAVRQTPVRSESPEPGIYIQRAEKILSSVIDCMRHTADELGEEKRQIEAIGFTGQMAGFMGVGQNWEDITAWSCSLDTRYIPYEEKQLRQHKRRFFETGGTNAPLMAPKCEWFRTEYPGEASRIVKYMMISSYVIGRLGDMRIEDAVMDSSYLTWTGLADIRKKTWSDELCDVAGISKDALPRVVDAYTVCAHLSEEMAKSTGLRAGIPLAAGTGDKIAGCIGSGVLDSGDCIFEASSYGAVSCLVNGLKLNSRERNYDAIPALTKDSYYMHKYFPGSGITLKWFLDTFSAQKRGDSEDATDYGEAFRYIEHRVAQIPPGSDGLIGIGLLGGSAMPLDGAIKGSWIGFSWHHKKEHFYRALLESYAYETALTLESIRAMYPSLPAPQIKMIGGGAKSAVWPQILADVTGSPFLLLDRNDNALWGTAALAGYGIGLISDLNTTLRHSVQLTETLFPDPERHRIYRKYTEIYRHSLEKAHAVCEELGD